MSFNQYLMKHGIFSLYGDMSYSLRKKILLDYILEGLYDIEGATT
jgi:hypothetical protein